MVDYSILFGGISLGKRAAVYQNGPCSANSCAEIPILDTDERGQTRMPTICTRSSVFVRVQFPEIAMRRRVGSYAIPRSNRSRCAIDEVADGAYTVVRGFEEAYQ